MSKTLCEVFAEEDRREEPPTTRELIALRRAAAGKPIGVWVVDLLGRGWIDENRNVTPAGAAVLEAHPSPIARMNRRRREKGPRPPLNVNVAREVQADMRAEAEARGLGLGEAWERAGRMWLGAEPEEVRGDTQP